MPCAAMFAHFLSQGANDEKLAARRGFLELMDTMPQVPIHMGVVPLVCVFWVRILLQSLLYLERVDSCPHWTCGCRSDRITERISVQAMKMDFVPYIERLFPAMLMGVTGEKESDLFWGEQGGERGWVWMFCSRGRSRLHSPGQQSNSNLHVHVRTSLTIPPSRQAATA